MTDQQIKELLHRHEFIPADVVTSEQPELDIALSRLSADDRKLDPERLIEAVAFIFLCEWDCSLKGWYDGSRR
jgi:hypothetical protein